MDEEKQNNTENQLQNGLGAILSNPDMLAKMAEAVKKLGVLNDSSDDGAKEKSAQAASAPAAENTVQTALGNMGGGANPLAALASNPEIISKLPDIISAFGGMGGGGRSGATGGEKKDQDRRTALLLALRPYLSPRRREIVDYLIKMNKLGDVFKNLM